MGADVGDRPIALQARLRYTVMKYLTALPEKDCYRNVNELYDVPEIRALCQTKDKLAIMLSDMYRNGKHKFVTRVPSVVPGTNIRYAYGATVVASRSHPVSEPGTLIDSRERKEPLQKEAPEKTVVQQPYGKPLVEVGDDRVVIDTANVRIVVHLKQGGSAC